MTEPQVLKLNYGLPQTVILLAQIFMAKSRKKSQCEFYTINNKDILITGETNWKSSFLPTINKNKTTTINIKIVSTPMRFKHNK